MTPPLAPHELMRAQQLLSTRLISQATFREAIGGPISDLGAIARYLHMPVAARPVLSPYFDAAFYTACYAAARAVGGSLPLAEGADPLLDFLDTGLGLLRMPHPLIDPHYIADRDPLILGSVPSIDTLMDLLDYDLADPSPYFDCAFYATHFGGAPPEGGLLRHFLTEGAALGLRPNKWFDPHWYRHNNTDVPRDAMAATRHFVMTGDAEYRDPGPEFDSKLYLRRYPDVTNLHLRPLLHYLVFGRAEGRQATAERAAPPRPPNMAPSDLPSLGSAQPLHLLSPGNAQPSDAATVVAADADMRARLTVAHAARKDQVTVATPHMASAIDPVACARALRFRSTHRPRVSILIAAFNELATTVECLMALQAAGLGADVEIVVADDASTDPAMAVLAEIRNIVLIRHKKNLGFLESCNAALGSCSGAYVLLLNNDTQVQRGAIEALAATLDADDSIGACGPKLLYPNGRLQEAGCTVRRDGSSVMVGLFGDPTEPAYNRDRDVAYCSGAALLVRRALLKDQLFDPEFRPAYCEDVDLCLRLRAAGHRIRYVHNAVVVHHLSISNKPDGEARRLRLIARNQQRLLERWGSDISRMNDIRVLAFYLPQFHRTPENDLWWGAGFTEWTNVTRAQPSYAGHYQPHLPTDLGFYDLCTTDALTAQANLAARYGIEGFAVYYYNFGTRRVLSRPLDLLRDHPEIPFRFCLCWANENWTRHWDGGSHEVLMEQRYDAETLSAIVADAVEHARDPRAITLAGRPIFLVYRPLQLPDVRGFAAACRMAFAEAGFDGVHLVYVESMEAVDAGVAPADLGFDACVEFPPHGRGVPCTDSPALLKPGWSGYRYDYPATVVEFVTRPGVPYVRYPAVFPGWDNTPRQPSRGSSFDRATPEAFGVYVEAKIEELLALHSDGAKLLFVNAWNEWAEGAHLEPDTGFGHRWLEALAAARDNGPGG